MNCTWGYMLHSRCPHYNWWFWLLVIVVVILFVILLHHLRQRQQKRCPGCNSSVESVYLRCPQCGRELKSHCPGCHHIVEKSWQCCPHCKETCPCGAKNNTTKADVLSA